MKLLNCKDKISSNETLQRIKRFLVKFYDNYIGIYSPNIYYMIVPFILMDVFTYIFGSKITYSRYLFISPVMFKYPKITFKLFARLRYFSKLEYASLSFDWNSNSFKLGVSISKLHKKINKEIRFIFLLIFFKYFF